MGLVSPCPEIHQWKISYSSSDGTVDLEIYGNLILCILLPLGTNGVIACLPTNFFCTVHSLDEGYSDKSKPHQGWRALKKLQLLRRNAVDLATCLHDWSHWFELFCPFYILQPSWGSSAHKPPSSSLFELWAWAVVSADLARGLAWEYRIHANQTHEATIDRIS